MITRIAKQWTCGNGHVFTFGDEDWHWEQNQGIEDGFPIPRYCTADDEDSEPCMDSSHLIFSDTREEAEQVAKRFTTPKPKWAPDVKRIQKACALAARDLLGSGYVDSYYFDAGADFVGIAEHAAYEGYEAGLRDAQVRDQVRLPITREVLRGAALEAASTAVLLRKLRDEDGLPHELVEQALDYGQRVIQALAEVDAAEATS